MFFLCLIQIGSSSSQNTGALSSLGQPASATPTGSTNHSQQQQQPSVSQQQSQTAAGSQTPTASTGTSSVQQQANQQQSHPKQQRPIRSSTKLPPPSKVKLHIGKNSVLSSSFYKVSS